MHLNDFNTFIKNSFGNLIEQFRENDEYGFNNPPSKPFFRVGYTTNLTPEVIKKTADENVQLIITHLL
jgi:putative NIF3 family GTP cyclohydrolase 1 type 2